MSTTTLIILVLAIAALALAGVMFYQREKTRKLKAKFGPEYDRLTQQEGSARKGETILESRQKRVEKFNVKPLTREESDRFAAEWRAAQERFVDDPRRAGRDSCGLDCHGPRWLPRCQGRCRALRVGKDPGRERDH